MFERFTDRARRVVVLAQEEALLLGHGWIGTEHLLLGLLREEEGLARRVLDVLGLTLEPVREQVRTLVPAGQQAPTGQVPFTPEAKRVLELSLREALQLGHDDIGTEHILLGVAREGEGIGAQVLAAAGADVDRVRQEVIGYTLDWAAMTAGTGRETPEEAGAGGVRARVVGPRLELSVDDPEVLRALEEVVVTGPVEAALPSLRGALRATTGDVGGPLDDPAGEMVSAYPEWPLSEWDPSTGGAFYAVMSRPAGLVGRLQTAVGMDSGVVRQVLLAWVGQAPGVPPADLETEYSYFSARVEEGPNGAFVVTHFAYGESGPDDWPRRPLAELLAFAADDLRVHHHH